MTRGTLNRIAAACAVFLAAAPAAALDHPVLHPGREPLVGPAYLGDRLEVRLRPDAARAARALVPRGPAPARLARLGTRALDRLAAELGGVTFEPEFRGETPPAPGSTDPDFTAFYIARLPDGAPLETALARFRALDEVASADPIAVLPVSQVPRAPNDSLWSRSTWFFQPSRRDIHAPEAWGETTGDSTIVIAILDTGVIPYHPDLGGSVAGWSGQIWTNPAEARGRAGVDDDGNGFVDDAHGWDFVAYDIDPGAQPGEDWRDEDNDPNDYSGHGTAVAGVAGALTDNEIGVAGVAWQVRLMPLRIGLSTRRDPVGLVDMSSVARAIRYATRMGAHVINASFATLDQAGLYAAADAAIRAGVAIVAAAGNDGHPHALADRPDVIAVAATDAADRLASFSNRGAFVDISAPGDGIISTYVAVPRAGPDSLAWREPAYVEELFGTSFAAPMAAGAVALMQARRRARGERPLEPMGALLRLRETADDIAAAQEPGVTGYGTGRLNLFRALTDPPTSSALRTGGRTVGPAVAIRTATGGSRILHATTGGKLLVLGERRDTVALVTLPGNAVSGPATADLGPGLGIGVFVSLAGGRVAGFDGFGAPLPGWPVAVDFGLPVTAPAIGDVDGDGASEVVAGSADGRVWAWRASGAVVPGFPALLDGMPPAGPVALSDLDGVMGVEIVVATEPGGVYAVRGDGARLPGWPVFLPPPLAGPVIGRLGAGPEPAVVVASGARLRAFRPDGTPRLSAPLTTPEGGVAAQDLALGDLDGDGADEIIVATAAPATIAAFDSSGAPLTARRWPRAVTAAAAGPPLIAQLRGDAAGHPEVLVMVAGGLLALTDSAAALAAFPKPGGAGALPGVTDLDGRGASQVLAGTGPDSLLYVYDAGPGSAAGRKSPWFTPRGNFARTASRLYAPPEGVLDAAPGRVADLAVAGATHAAVTLRWTATGDDGPTGRPAGYVLRADVQPLDEGSFEFAPESRDAPAAAGPGGEETFVFGGLGSGRRYWFAAKARDESGNLSAMSNVVAARTGIGGPLAGRSGPAVASRTQPSRVPVELYWEGAADPPGGSQRIRLYDVAGRVRRTLGLGAEPSGVVQWDGRDDRGDAVPAGLYFARLTSGSLHAHTRVVLLP